METGTGAFGKWNRDSVSNRKDIRAQGRSNSRNEDRLTVQQKQRHKPRGPFMGAYTSFRPVVSARSMTMSVTRPLSAIPGKVTREKGIKAKSVILPAIYTSIKK